MIEEGNAPSRRNNTKIKEDIILASWQFEVYRDLNLAPTLLPDLLFTFLLLPIAPIFFI